MSIKELLPIGSVVVLNEGQKRLMIYGVKQSNENGEGAEYDYLAVMYPEGNIGEQYQYLFNHSDIAKVCFRGFEDSERTEFIDRLSALYDKE